jgi:hypothetical protein
MSDVININGTKYTEEDFNEEQSYFIKQIRSLKVKSANIKFELDQVQVAENAFTNAVMVSMKASEDAKSETEVKTDEVVEVNTEAK